MQQEGENDVNMTCNDRTILIYFDSKVKQSFIVIPLDVFDDLMLHHDVCLLLFSEMHTSIKQGVKHTWKAWRTKEVDWEPILSIPTFPTKLPRHIGPRKEPHQVQHVLERLDSDCSKRLTCDGRRRL